MRGLKSFSRWFCTLTAPCTLGMASYDAVALGRPWLAPLGLLPCAVAAIQWITRERPAAPENPPAPARTARYPQGAPAGTCPICGMADEERFRIGLGEAVWKGQPAHESCVAWLDSGPKPPACECRMRQDGTVLTSENCVKHRPRIGALAGVTPAGYGWFNAGTCAYLVPIGTTQSTISAASVPHEVGVIPDLCPDCGTDRNTLGPDFEGGRLCDRCQWEHGRRLTGFKIAQAIGPRPAPPPQPYLEPGTATAPPGCLCRWKAVAGGYLVIDALSYAGRSLRPPQRCSVHDKPEDFLAGQSMAEFTASMDLLSEAIRRATGIPPNRT